MLLHNLCNYIRCLIMTEIVRLNCNLRGELASKFKKIKNLTGIQQNTEVVRLAINDFYNKTVKSEEA